MMKPAHALAIALCLVTLGDSASAQSPRPDTSSQQPASARRITARDGDIVVVDNDARVRVVRRRAANVHAIFNAAQAWIVVLVDYIDPTSGSGDDRVDFTYSFNSVSGAWPLGERWEGTATVEDYFAVPGDSPMANGLGLVTANGLVQLLGGLSSDLFHDQSAVAVLLFQGSGRSGGGRQSFAEEEQRQVANAMRNAEGRASLPSGATPRVQTGISMGVVGGVVGPISGGVSVVSNELPAQAPVRVGSQIQTPKKVVDVPPVYPETARAAGIRGLVVLEVTVGADGSVTNAHVLRSIPLLDAAALDAVRQWRYEPTLLNGAPVPVITTATVRFP